MQTLLFLLPPEWTILAIVAIGFAVMFGMIRPRAACGWILAVCLFAAAGPILDALYDLLPGWLLLLLALGTAVSLFRWVASLVIGDDAAGHMLGTLAADVVRGCFRLLFLPFRLLGWMLFRRNP